MGYTRDGKGVGRKVGPGMMDIVVKTPIWQKRPTPKSHFGPGMAGRYAESLNN